MANNLQPAALPLLAVAVVDHLEIHRLLVVQVAQELL
jgi:hypothetical protein